LSLPGFNPTLVARRGFLAAGGGAAGLLAVQPGAARAITVDSARAQWERAVAKLAELDRNYDALAAKGGGDAVRAELGTAGDNAASPLYQIDKALNKLTPEASDPGEFSDAVQNFEREGIQCDPGSGGGSERGHI